MSDTFLWGRGWDLISKPFGELFPGLCSVRVHFGGTVWDMECSHSSSCQTDMRAAPSRTQTVGSDFPDHTAPRSRFAHCQQQRAAQSQHPGLHSAGCQSHMNKNLPKQVPQELEAGRLCPVTFPKQPGVQAAIWGAQLHLLCRDQAGSHPLGLWNRLLRDEGPWGRALSGCARPGGRVRAGTSWTR